MSRQEQTSDNGLQTLDIRGVVCPMTWVKTEFRLQQLADGEVLEVLVDSGLPASTMPVNVKDAGHRILKMSRNGDHVVVWIQCNGGRQP